MSALNLIEVMHKKFGHSINDMDVETLKEFFKFRKRFIEEEINELKSAKTPEDIVDALIDIMVVAAGTLDLFKVNVDMALREVMLANLSKESGINESRQNEFGLPDLIKPKDFSPPNHSGNTGAFKHVL